MADPASASAAPDAVADAVANVEAVANPIEVIQVVDATGVVAAATPAPPTPLRGLGVQWGESARRVEQTLADAVERAVLWLPEFVSTAVILLLAVVTVKLISRGIGLLVERTHLDESVGATLRTLSRWLIVPLVVAAIAARWGVLENFWAAVTAAVTLVAIGFFAVWSVLSNVLCSVILLANRPFRIGDEIKLVPDPIRGRVLAIGLTHTTLLGAKGDMFQVPNNLFFQRVVKRYPRRTRRLDAAAALQAEAASAGSAKTAPAPGIEGPSPSEADAALTSHPAPPAR